MGNRIFGEIKTLPNLILVGISGIFVLGIFVGIWIGELL